MVEQTTERRDHMRRMFEELSTTRDRTARCQLRDNLIEGHIGLARHLARRFVNRGEPYDDLVQVASMALVKAVDRFDPERGVSFGTFATRTILGEIKRHFRDKGWAVRAPRRIQDLYVDMAASIPLLAQELGRAPSIAELALHLGATEEEVLEAVEAGQGYRTASIDAPLTGREDTTLSDALGADDAGFSQAEWRTWLRPLMDKLPTRARLVIELRFGEGLTQSEIASRIGISQMQVSRLLQMSLRRLREEFSV